jgi:dTDP-L-rhamnose 4-epimerase
VYALTKVDQERLALIMGAQLGLPVVALRYACTYGPRQSPFNPYTGVISIFAGRLANGLAPVVFEDGAQVRDLCFVEDIARANLLAAETDRLDGRAVNVGTGRPTRIIDLARAMAAAIGVDVEPELKGQFRPGEMRALIPDVSLARDAGFEARVGLEDGIRRYLEWRTTQGPMEERFAGAERRMAEQRVLHRVTAR